MSAAHAPEELRLLDCREAPLSDPGKLESFDWIVVNSSGGKDSQAMLDLVCERAEAEGVLSRVVVVHADLGRVEWQGTREIAEAQATRYGVRFVVVDRAQGDLLAHVESRHAALRAKGNTTAPAWPSSVNRWCTSDHKTHQVYRLFTHLVKEFRAPLEPLAKKIRPCRILNCLGMRAEESPKRSKMLPMEADKPASNGKREVVRWLPLHGWSEAQVWERIDASRTSDLRHFAYALGMPRVSCCFCILASRSALLVAGKHNPELLAEYVAVEKRIGHKFRVDLSMADLQAAVQAREAPRQVEGWKA
jgi:3'-phosphoadenosine 5'-phosphosulfate sulfotransferase (PAPS reductase)/FAD synthetase